MSESLQTPSSYESESSSSFNNNSQPSFQSQCTGTSTFQVGDRVIVHSLLKASHLNGRHGCIGGEMDKTTGRYPIDFDTWPNRVMARDDNLEPEPSSSAVWGQENNENERKDYYDDDRHGGDEGEEEDDGDYYYDYDYEGGGKHQGADHHHHRRRRHRVADVEDGVLVESEGRSLGLILDTMRFLVGNVLLRDPCTRRGLIDIEELRRQADHEKIHILMNTAWEHWEDAKPYYTPDNLNVYELTRQFFRDLPQANAGHKMPTEFYMAMSALNHKTAVRGWNKRLEGEFWIVGCNEDNGGTFLVANANHNLVFEVFGLRISLLSRVEEEEPILIKATLLPWYGRLVCDQAIRATSQVADEELEDELFNSVDLAVEEGRVVEKLRELELPESEDGSAQQASTTLTESQYLRMMADMPVSRPDEAIWCMRRRGYTENDNPHHLGVIINGVGGVAVGPFSCSALEPTSLDILKALVAYCGEDGKVLPAVLLIDEKKCFERMKFILKHFDISVQYYPPPTPEETEAVLNRG